MAYAAGADPLCYPGTTVLRNLLDIEDAVLLDEAELALVLIRAVQPFPAGKFDRKHYLDLHRHLFQDVYSWAGQIRSIRIGKEGNWFCYPEYIDAELERVFAEFGDPDRLETMTVTAFASHVGHFLAELNAVHPFREGNGRTQLAFLAALADHAGFRFNEGEVDKNRTLQAMIESFTGEEAALVSLVKDIID